MAEGTPSNPTLNLNEVERNELAEHRYAAGTKVAGATDPYTGEGLKAEGTSGFSPAVPPAAMAGTANLSSEGDSGEPHGLAKVKESVKGALGLGQ